MTEKSNVLTDHVKAKDETPYGTHQRVADYIRTLICEGVFGINIGIEGGWGTGKSTVIAILMQELQNVRKNFVFYFDAWAHEGDYLRRAFLESLIEAIEEDKNTPKTELKYLEEQKAIVANRVVSRKIWRKTLFTWKGALSLIMACLIPVGAELIAGTFKEVDFRIAPLYQAHWWFVIGVLMVLVPMAMIFYTFFSEIKNKGRKTGGIVGTEESDELTNETSQETERTTIEFERIFRDLIATLERCNRSRFIVVIDNLDRVSAKRGLDIWSTLQIFSRKDGAVCTGHPYSLPLWVVVPYDGDAIDALWQGSEPRNQGGGDGYGAIRPAKAFLDKTFQIRVDVPELFAGSWTGFVAEQMPMAMPWLSEHQKETVVRVLGLTISEKVPIPCMRGMKTYLNEIGALYALYGERVSFVAICYYAALRYVEGRKIGTIKDDIIKGMLPDAKMSVFPGFSGLKGELAALVYGVPVEKGIEQLLDKPIFNAIANGDYNQLEMMAKEHEDVFKEVLRQIPGRLSQSKDGALLWRWIGAIEHLGCAFARVDVGACVENNWEILESAILLCPWACVWSAIINCSKDEKFRERILTAYGIGVAREVHGGAKSERNYAAEIKAFNTELVKEGLRVVLKCSGLGLNGLVSLAHSNGDNLDGLQKVVSYDNAKILLEELSQYIGSNGATAGAILPVAHEMARNVEGNWDGIVKAIIARCENDLIGAMRFLFSMDTRNWSKEEMSALRSRIASRGFLSVVVAAGADDWQILSYIVLRYENSIKAFHSAVQQQGYYYSTEHPRGVNRIKGLLESCDGDYVNFVCDRVVDTRQYLFIWDWMLEGPVVLVVEILAELLRRDCDFICAVSPAVECYAKAITALPDELKSSLTKGFVRKSDLDREVCKADDIWAATPDGVRLILEQSDDKDLWARVHKAFGGMSAGEWGREFNGNGPKVKMVEMFCSKRGEIAQLAMPYAEALQQHLVNRLASSNTNEDGETVARMKIWLSALTTTFRTIVSRAIVEWCVIHRFRVSLHLADIVLDCFGVAYEQMDGGNELSRIILDMVDEGRDVGLVGRIVEKLGRRAQLAPEAERALKSSEKGSETR